MIVNYCKIHNRVAPTKASCYSGEDMMPCSIAEMSDNAAELIFGGGWVMTGYGGSDNYGSASFRRE